MDDYLWEILQAQGGTEVSQNEEPVRRKMEEQLTAGVAGGVSVGENRSGEIDVSEENRRKGLEAMEEVLGTVTGAGQAGAKSTWGNMLPRAGMVEAEPFRMAVQEEKAGAGYRTVGETVETEGRIYRESQWGWGLENGRQWEKTGLAPEMLSLFFQRDSRRYS